MELRNENVYIYAFFVLIWSKVLIIFGFEKRLLQFWDREKMFEIFERILESLAEVFCPLFGWVYVEGKLTVRLFSSF